MSQIYISNPLKSTSLKQHNTKENSGNKLQYRDLKVCQKRAHVSWSYKANSNRNTYICECRLWKVRIERIHIHIKIISANSTCLESFQTLIYTLNQYARIMSKVLDPQCPLLPIRSETVSGVLNGAYRFYWDIVK